MINKFLLAVCLFILPLRHYGNDQAMFAFLIDLLRRQWKDCAVLTF